LCAYAFARAESHVSVTGNSPRGKPIRTEN
jgi:hypothetical protein